MSPDLEPTIGLEIHTQLATQTKLFCSCPVDTDAEPNTHTCPTCLGLPGSLPQLNERAVELAVMAGRAIDADIASAAQFDRKHYFYPDLPKGFQITQYEEPICRDGLISVDGDDIRVRRAHLEEDPGRSTYGDTTIKEADHSYVDYNRSGVPLLEFVTEPDISSPEQARTVVDKLASRLEYIGVMNRSMDGAMRVDANVSVSPDETSEGTRVEIKNIGSASSVEDALMYELTRQRDTIRRGEELQPTTRHWDDSRNVTVELREKEGEADYRYFREYDLPVLRIADE